MASGEEEGTELGRRKRRIEFGRGRGTTRGMAAGEQSSLWLHTDEPLLWLGGAGHETRSAASYFYDARLRKDRHFALQLTLAGEGFYQRGRRVTPLPAGTAFFDHLPGDFYSGYPPRAVMPYELVFVSFAGRSAETWCRRIIAEHGNVLHFGRGSEVETLMLSVAHRYLAGTLGDRYQISALLYQLLMGVASSLKTAEVFSSVRVRQALSAIAEGASDPRFNVSRLAQSLDCSREHLTRQFISATGVSPSEYLQRQRLRLALRALHGGNEKLESLARRCGFSSANYLCRMFRERYGVSPAQVRANPSLVSGV